MDSSSMAWALTSAAALVAGIVVGWWAAKGRTQALMRAALTSAEAEARSELATVHERARSHAEQLAAERQQLQTAQQAVEDFRAKAQKPSVALRILTLSEARDNELCEPQLEWLESNETRLLCGELERVIS